MRSPSRVRYSVSVPFTSGSSLQHADNLANKLKKAFQFPLHRDPRCNFGRLLSAPGHPGFQFPLHRDPRCNRWGGSSMISSSKFQFPLHRDPRCNRENWPHAIAIIMFQFPLHRDPRCNLYKNWDEIKDFLFQFPLHRDPRCNLSGFCMSGGTKCFSSLYIGILAATRMGKGRQKHAAVSVPFTSGSSLQPTFFLRFHTSLYWYFTMNTKRKPVGIFE